MFDAIDTRNVDVAIGRLFFGFVMPFNIARSLLWKEAMRMVNNMPKGYVPPSYEKLCTIVLDDEKKHIEGRLQDIRDSWSYTYVSIVSGGSINIGQLHYQKCDDALFPISTNGTDFYVAKTSF
ncbi:hypothetical protein SUGI_0050290 [Cryptomeria japonica]|nr:hypothetical protein SUGI_0050290 [Cryptomeria japonica]